MSEVSLRSLTQSLVAQPGLHADGRVKCGDSHVCDARFLHLGCVQACLERTKIKTRYDELSLASHLVARGQSRSRQEEMACVRGTLTAILSQDHRCASWSATDQLWRSSLVKYLSVCEACAYVSRTDQRGRRRERTSVPLERVHVTSGLPHVAGP